MSQNNSTDRYAGLKTRPALLMVEDPISPTHNPFGKLRLEKHVKIKEHRSGWRYCIDSLQRLHNEHGVLLDDFVEQRFSWDFPSAIDRGLIPYLEPWVGFMHNPPNMPVWFEYCSSPQVVLQRQVMQESLKYCKGLYVFSEHHRKWLEQHVDVPVNTVYHPTDLNVQHFSIDRYLANPRKKIVQVGYWLRKLHSIRHLPTHKFTKVWLVTSKFALKCRDREAATMDIYTPTGSTVFGQYEEFLWVDNLAYDNLLSCNLVFLNFYDVSAANSVLECIARNTPVLVNRLPAVVEYLGEEYPLYFDDLADAARKAEDDDRVAQAHDYLRNMDKQRLEREFFIRSIETSPIYMDLRRSDDAVRRELLEATRG